MALLALARAAGDAGPGAEPAFSFSWKGGDTVSVTSPTPVVQRTLDAASGTDATLVVENRGETALYPRLVLSGLPPIGKERAASNGLVLAVE